MSHNLRRHLACFLLLFGCIAFALPTHAQDLDDVTITGRVLDTNNAAIPGAKVTATLEATGATRTVTADAEGRYRIIELKPGTYTLTVIAGGFAENKFSNIVTVAGQNVQLDAPLSPQGATVEIEISDDTAPPIDTTRTVVGGTVGSQQLEDLPNNSRSPLDLIFTLGGVTEEPLSTRDIAEDRGRTTGTVVEEAGVFALAGGPAYSNNITLDGLDNNDDRGATFRFQPSLEAVQEVQVITNQFSAEYGRASGGRVNITTRSGTNKYRGRLFYFFRDEALNANTARNTSLGLKRLPLQENNPGFTFGGPIVLPKIYDGHKRTFFFTAYEYDNIFDSVQVDTLVPTTQNPIFPLPAPTNSTVRTELVGGIYPGLTPLSIGPFLEKVTTPARNTTWTTKVDHRFTDKHDISGSYLVGRLRNLRQVAGGTRLLESLIGRTRNSDAVAFSDNYIISPNLVNQLRGQYSRLTPALVAPESRAPVVLIAIRDNVNPSFTGTNGGTLVTGNSTTGATDRKETRFQIQDSLVFLKGAHAFKFGGDFQRIHSTFIDLGDATGTFNFNSVADFFANRVLRYRHNFNTESTQTNNYFGGFIQDQWRLRQGLTFSYGGRYENESIINDRNNFSPRIALAYAPKDSAKTVIRLGFGSFYNRVLLRTVDDFSLGRSRLALDTNTIAGTQTSGTRMTVLDQIRPPTVLTADSPIVQQFATTSTTFNRRLNPNIKISESYQFNAGFEREIGQKLVFEANFTYNRGAHLWREFNANAPILPAGFSDFAAYLTSRSFDNTAINGVRPISSSAANTVRFAIGSLTDNTIPPAVNGVTTFNLNAPSSTTTLNAALATVRNLRPNPAITQFEELISVGDSKYRGLTLELRRRVSRINGFGVSFRGVYTLSRLIDDGVVNTSSAVVAGDFNRENSRSLQDRRHRFTFSGSLDTPRMLGRLRFSPILRIASGAPFNLSAGGVDRNLDDVSNDRTNFSGDISQIIFRQPGSPFNAALAAQFTQPTIGTVGNLSRNAGQGPGFYIFDLNMTREFRIKEKMRLRPVIEVNNIFNRTTYSYGSDFINFNQTSATFQNTFLVPQRTLRHRQMRLGLRFDF